MKKIPDNYRLLVEALLDKTLKGQIDWEEPHRGTFSFSWIDRSINVWSWTDEYDPESGGYAIAIRDDKGETIDTFSARPSDVGYELLVELYDNARRRSRDVDSTIKEILGSLP